MEERGKGDQVKRGREKRGKETSLEGERGRGAGETEMWKRNGEPGKTQQRYLERETKLWRRDESNREGREDDM